jgi:hypothetical protein
MINRKPADSIRRQGTTISSDSNKSNAQENI